jgi:hypothetical protein
MTGGYRTGRDRFGITEVQSSRIWLVRLSALDAVGIRYTINRSLSWKDNGGKRNALDVAKKVRDEILDHPDVIRFREESTRLSGKHYHKSHHAPAKRAFAGLPGIHLVVEKKPNGSRYEAIKGCVGSPPTKNAPHCEELSRSFPIATFGVKGALKRAVAHREKTIGRSLYKKKDIESEYTRALKRHGDRWGASGWALGEEDPPVTIPEWRKMKAVDFRAELPPKPFQTGVCIIIRTRTTSSGVRLLYSYFFAVEMRDKIRTVYFQRSIQDGLWSGFRDAVAAAREKRGEQRLSNTEMRYQYELWIKGRKRRLNALGLAVNE